MPNVKINNNDPTSRHNISINDSDWNKLNSLANKHNISISSLFRAFIRTYEKNQGIMGPLLEQIIEENDKVYPEALIRVKAKNKKKGMSKELEGFVDIVDLEELFK